MKYIKYLLSSIVFVLILSHATPSYAAMKPVATPFQITDMVLYDVNNQTTKSLSNYAGTSKVLILGRAVSCYNTDATIKYAEALAKGMDASKVTFVFCDYDDNVANTKSYTNIHNIIMCAPPIANNNYANYTWQRYYQCLGEGNMQSLLFPLVMVVDKNGYVQYFSNGITDTNEIYDALKAVNNGDLPFNDDKACTTDVAKSNLAKHKLYRTDDIAMSYYKVVYNQEYYTSGLGTVMGEEPTGIRTSVLNLLKEQSILTASASISPEDKVNAIKALATSIIAGKISDYDKVLAIHDWVSDNIYYDYMYLWGYTSSTNLSAYDVLTNKTTVCEGYANLTTMLIRAAGIPCKKIIGYGQGYSGWPSNLLTANPTNHAWNEAYVNGKWMFIDCTWDSGNTYMNSTYTKGTTSHTYFDPFIAALSEDHYVVKYEEDVIDNKAPVIDVKSTGGDFVELTWQQISNAYGYDIYRDSTGTGNYEKISTTYRYQYGDTVNFKDKTCSSNTQYSYKVVPYCNAGTTPFYGLTSNAISGKTTLPQQQITAITSYSKKMGDAAFSLNAATSGNGQLTYSSSATNIVSVDSTGKVTIVGVGTAKITITAAATATYTQNTLIVTIVVNKGSQSITAPYYFSKTYGDSDFSLGATGTVGGGALSYASDNTSIVTVSSDGIVSIKGSGNAKITITAAATSNYSAVSYYVYVYIGKGIPKINIPSTYYYKTYTDAAFSLDATTNGNGQLSYTLSNQNVVSVDATGKVTIVGSGSVMITITASETTTYYKAIKYVSVYVSKASPKIKASATVYSKNYGDSAFTLGAITTGNGQLTYTSSNQNVVTVDTSGKVTIVGTGSAYITITAGATTNYSKASIQVSITVKKATQKITCSTSYIKTYGNSPFSLGATVTKGGSKLTYSSSNSSIVTVSTAGLVTIKGCGKAVITITASENANYNKATFTIQITINPKSVKMISIASTITQKMNLSWQADTTISGYEIVYSTDKNFAGSKSILATPKTTSTVISGLQKGKVYYVKIRAYIIVNGTKIYGGFSEVKNVKIK